MGISGSKRNSTIKTSGGTGVKYYGIYRARCINNKDPKGQGKILVHVYSRDGNISYSEDIHQWIPVLSPYGGLKGMGFYMIPPIHAEGFVIFEQGNLTNPIWLGTYPYAPSHEIDKEATKAAGYGVVKTIPTIPPEMKNDPTTIILKTQYPALANPNIESNENKVENLFTMSEEKFELTHVNQSGYEYSPGGQSTAKPSSYIRLTDSGITLGVKGQDDRVFELQIDSAGIRMTSNLGDTVSIADGEISIIGSENAQINIRALDEGAININGKQVIIDGEQIVIGPPGTTGGGGVVTSDCICPFTGMTTHVASGKTIVGG